MELNKFFDTSTPAKIVVLGDVMLDRYVFGGVSRISPEAPVPILNHSSIRQVIGGSGNVAANIAEMGGEAILVSLTGDDTSRKTILSLCQEYKVDAKKIVKSKSRQTTVKTRFLSGTQQILRLDDEKTEVLSEGERNDILDNLKAAIKGANCLILSDYDKGIFKSDLASSVIEIANEQGIPILVDPKGQNYSKYVGATSLTPNLKELREAVQRHVETDDDVVKAARELIYKFDLDFVLATRSENGMSIISAEDEKHIPTYAKEVFDVSGAGDTVIAALALGLARGMERDDAAYIANVAAGLAVSKQGTARITAKEIQSELQKRKVITRTDKTVLTWKEAKEQCQEWQEAGLTVGMTNGCFDILHLGHVSSLNKARQDCDKLILALNSDASVSRLKGKSRPINNALDRAGVLAGLRAVNAIVVFEEDTPLKIIKHLMPDRLFKGADYAIEDVVGGKEVMENGGEVILIDFVEGHSTTSLVEKMATGES